MLSPSHTFFRMDLGELLRGISQQTGLEVTGGRTLSANAAQADALLAQVLDGPKRAISRSIADIRPDDGPFPEPGQHWALLDGNSRPRAVIRIEELRIGPLYSVDAAFAWEHGEGDRTRGQWISAQEERLLAQGIEDLEGETIVFEHLSVVWPVQDQPAEWHPGIRELRVHEHPAGSPRPDLPALAAIQTSVAQDTEVVGLLRFEPEPDDLTLVTVTGDTPEIVAALHDAFALRRAADRRQR